MKLVNKITAIALTAVLASTPALAADEKSADEMAKELANPNNPNATLNFKYQYQEMKTGQANQTLVFQPSMPFTLDNGDMMFFRPAIPLMVDLHTAEDSNGNWESETGIGDISFDLMYGGATKTGMIWGAGALTSLPTGDKDLGMGETTAFGPEFIVAQLGKTSVLGVHSSHVWDVSGDIDVSRTNTKVIAVYLPGGGYNIGTSPDIAYDHVADQWTIPVNLSVGKTVMLNDRAWKFSVGINYYVEHDEEFGPDWMIEFTVGPVVENVINNWF